MFTCCCTFKAKICNFLCCHPSQEFIPLYCSCLICITCCTLKAKSAISFVACPHLKSCALAMLVSTMFNLLHIEAESAISFVARPHLKSCALVLFLSDMFTRCTFKLHLHFQAASALPFNAKSKAAHLAIVQGTLCHTLSSNLYHGLATWKASSSSTTHNATPYPCGSAPLSVCLSLFSIVQQSFHR